jgi:predicted phosphoribosyltransferase
MADAKPLVLGLARGGVPVAYEVAQGLGAPLDVMVVRKLGVPHHPELAMGALAPGGTRVLNDDVIRLMHIPGHVVDDAAAREDKEIERRQWAYRGGRPPPEVRSRTVIVVDDGLATGASMRAAIMALRSAGADGVTAAVPTGSSETCREMLDCADRVVCLTEPEPFFAVGKWYEDFSPTTDEEVRDLLAREGEHHASA